MRWLVGSIADWDSLFAEAFKACRSGGWLESHETSPTITSDDGTVAEDSALGQWGKFFIEGSKKLGTSFLVVEEDTQKQAMERAGFVDIQEFDFKVSNLPSKGLGSILTFHSALLVTGPEIRS
jgi:hypothetical protein